MNIGFMLLIEKQRNQLNKTLDKNLGFLMSEIKEGKPYKDQMFRKFMYLIRNVFHASPGKAKDLVKIFKNAAPHLEASGIAKRTRILTDGVSTFWTVVFESEVEDLNVYMDMAKTLSDNKEFGEAMKGYIDLVTGGYREVFRIE